IFLTLMDRGWLNDLKMFKLIGRHDIDWLALRTKFWPVSMVLVIGGMSLFGFASATDTESVYDIEFLGGTSVQIELKPGVNLSDDDIRRRITSENGDSNSSAVVWLRQAADALKQSTVKPGKTSTQFVMTSDTLIAEQITALMLTKGRRQKDALVDRLEVGGVSAEGNTCRFDTRPVPVPAVGDADPGERPMTLEEFQKAVADAADYALKAAQNLSTSRIQTVFEMGEQADANAKAFEIITVETNKQLVQEAVLACLGDDLAIERPINFVRVTDDTHPQGFYPIDEDAHYLSDVIGGQANFDVRRYKGGVVLQFDQLDPPQTIAELDKRIREIRLQAGFGEGKWRSYGLFGLTGAGGSGDDERFSKVALTVVDEDLPYYEDVDLWRLNVATPEAEQATAALQSEKALRKVVQFAPQVAEQTKNQAILAVAVALAAIVAYVGFRFGSMLFGLAAIVALVHDVSITLGLITLSDYFRGGTLGRVFLIQDFKIDLPMIAAMLTIIGYSLNDTIVVFDRIRENRGKMAVLKAKTINASINQTLSRTLLTSITTFMVVAIMYWLGGPGVHGFAFALVVGIVVGTYSSIGVATPLLYRPKTLHVVVYALIALGIVGAVAVMSNDLTVLGIVGAVVGLALIWAITTELRSERDYGGMAASPA
ncbi:MAG: protein translocase subunit SecF, partial [Phycisphaerae bacterium]